MGSALEVGKLVCASWLKANWERAPRLMKLYMTTAVIVLMLITSMGIFGFLSKAHSDQSLVSGDVIARISVYDEKIKTEKENIEANRKALKQMDEAVDQSMARSTTEQGANRAVNIRQQQAKERTRLQKEITDSQKKIASLNEERAPIAAEVRKVEAEVGPLKYIAAFVYGATDETILEKAVTWVIITIIIVFDPLAVIMLLAAQMTFGWKKEEVEPAMVPVVDIISPETTSSNEPKYNLDDGALTDDQLRQINDLLAENAVRTEPTLFTHTEVPSETPLTALGGDITAPEEPVVPGTTESELDKWNKMIEEAEKEVAKEKEVTAIKAELVRGEDLLQEESKKKTYMTKDQLGKIQIKNRET